MKIPALRAQIGIWVYYTANLTFRQIADNVKRVDDELHKSVLLREMLQRSINDNYKNITSYLKNQEERFFNAIILAVYDGAPEWHEVRLEYDDGEEFSELGVIELSGKEKIFPIDGQHRVEGIKKLLNESDKYDNEKVPVIFIGHNKNEEGMQRARRMFSTLNRYAKPVSMRDIIALDEDDIIAIVSRELIDNNKMFLNERILDSKTKAIPENNTKAFTTIITFYECNKELLWMLIEDRMVKDLENNNVRGKSKLNYFIRIRPKDKDIEEFLKISSGFWQSIRKNIEGVAEYFESENPDASNFRNKSGGLLIFRPAALIPFTKAIIRIKKFEERSFDDILKNFPKDILQLKHKIWNNILWNNEKKIMIMNNQSLVEQILLYSYNRKMLSDKETNKIISELKSIWQLNNEMDVKENLTEILKDRKDEE